MRLMRRFVLALAAVLLLAGCGNTFESAKDAATAMGCPKFVNSGPLEGANGTVDDTGACEVNRLDSYAIMVWKDSDKADDGFKKLRDALAPGQVEAVLHDGNWVVLCQAKKVCADVKDKVGGELVAAQ